MISLLRCVILLYLAPMLCFNGGSHVEGSYLAPFPFETHVFCTLVRFTLVALPWSVVVAFSFPFASVVGLCGFLFCLLGVWCPCPRGPLQWWLFVCIT